MNLAMAQNNPMLLQLSIKKYNLAQGYNKKIS